MSDSLGELVEIVTNRDLTRTALADDSGVVLDLDTLQVFSLNETGRVVFDAICDGVTSVEQIVERLVEEFEVDAQTARADILGFVSRASEQLRAGQ